MTSPSHAEGACVGGPRLRGDDTPSPTPTPLHTRLAERIQNEGPLDVSAYMAACLADPQHGFYMTGAGAGGPFGKDGHFITAPALTPLFGETLALALIAAWEEMGRPAPVRYVELGPGDGTLTGDIFRVLKRAAPQMWAGLSGTLVEISPVLARRQQQALGPYLTRLDWAESVADIPKSGPPEAPILLVANEFLDALPISQAVRGAGGTFHRRVVGLGAATAGEGPAGAPEPAGGAEDAAPPPPLTFTTAEEVAVAPDVLASLPPERTVLHNPVGVRDFIAQLAAQGFPNGAGFFVDYGGTRGAAQGADTGGNAGADGDTLQAVWRHQTVSPLFRPGEADISAAVDFGAFRTLWEGSFGAGTVGEAEPMGAFLLRHGLPVRAAHIRRGHAAAGEGEAVAALEAALHRLLHPSGMGELFKVVRTKWGV